MSREPEKEFDASPETVSSLVIARSPAKECDAAVSAMNRPEIWRFDEIEALLPKKALPEIEAVPPTSKVLFITLPALMPNKGEEPVSSKFPERDAFASKKESESTSKLPETRRSFIVEMKFE